jgi:hypothetical protein
MGIKPSVLQYAVAGAQLLPPIAALAGRRMAHPARRWIVVWCLVLTVESVLSRMLGLRHVNNLWLSYMFMPLTTGLALWALSHWQARGTLRLALRVSIPVVVVVSVALTVTIDDMRTFSLVAAPFHSLVLLLAVLGTLIHLSFRADGPLVGHDWFWVTSGLIIYAGTTAAVQPLGWYFLAEREELVRAVWTVSAAAGILAFIAIAGGLLCPELPISSGGSSSPPSSRSSSSRSDS